MLPVQAAAGLTVWAERIARSCRRPVGGWGRQAGVGFAAACNWHPGMLQRRWLCLLRPSAPAGARCRDSGRLRMRRLAGCTWVNQYLVIKYLGR